MSIEFTDKEKDDIINTYSNMSHEEAREKISCAHLLLLKARMMCMRRDCDGDLLNETLAEKIDLFLEDF